MKSYFALRNNRDFAERTTTLRFKRTRRSAFTLLEVVVGLTLMATVLVSSLLAFSAHRKQSSTADGKLAAVAIADDLLNAFSGLQEGIPNRGRGVVTGRPGWYWQTRVVGRAAPATVPLNVIRLEIARQTSAGTLRVLATVDVVEPIKP